MTQLSLTMTVRQVISSIRSLLSDMGNNSERKLSHYPNLVVSVMIV